MKVILDMPASFLQSNSSEVLRYWFSLHDIDGVFIDGNKTKPETQGKNQLGDWNKVALEISRSTLKERFFENSNIFLKNIRDYWYL